MESPHISNKEIAALARKLVRLQLKPEEIEHLNTVDLAVMWTESLVRVLIVLGRQAEPEKQKELYALLHKEAVRMLSQCATIPPAKPVDRN